MLCSQEYRGKFTSSLDRYISLVSVISNLLELIIKEKGLNRALVSSNVSQGPRLVEEINTI